VSFACVIKTPQKPLLLACIVTTRCASTPALCLHNSHQGGAWGHETSCTLNAVHAVQVASFALRAFQQHKAGVPWSLPAANPFQAVSRVLHQVNYVSIRRSQSMHAPCAAQRFALCIISSVYAGLVQTQSTVDGCWTGQGIPACICCAANGYGLLHCRGLILSQRPLPSSFCCSCKVSRLRH